MSAQPWGVALGCFVAGSLAAVGIANAVSTPTKIPDSTTGVITACMVKKTGAVRFINAQAGKTCTKKEKKVTFNKTGPQGPQGPSNGYVANTSATKGFNDLLVLPGTPKNRILELALPAGNYVINASTSVHRLGVTSTEIKCDIRSTSGTVTTVPATASVQVQFYDVPMAVTASYANTADATVYLRCDALGGAALTNEGEANGATITATRVAELTGP